MARFIRTDTIDLTGQESGTPVIPAGVVQVADHDGTGTPLTIPVLTSGTLAVLTPVAFASLPSSPTEGQLAAVTDSNTAVWGATVAGEGSNHVLAYYDGTNWTVAGK